MKFKVQFSWLSRPLLNNLWVRTGEVRLYLLELMAPLERPEMPPLVETTDDYCR